MTPTDIAHEWLSKQRFGTGKTRPTIGEFNRDMDLLSSFVRDCWPRSSSPVTHNPEEDAFYARIETKDGVLPVIRREIQTSAGPVCSVCNRGVGWYIDPDISPCHCVDGVAKDKES